MISSEQGAGVRLRSGGTLVDRALARLAGGPVSTARLAEEVLALRGNPRAAAAAVFALLGTEPRVRVDGQGVWTLAEPPKPSSALPLRLQDWVVVDVETTGGSPAHGHRVIEIAAVRVSGGRIAGRYSTLVDPGRHIPRMITSLTGISGEMVLGAPRFDEIVPDLLRELEGRVFVGHNASFDWRFVALELERCTGQSLFGRQLCTLRLARRILPHLRSRSLGSLAEYYGIGMETHHRALDDALATAHLLLRFIDDLEDRGIREWDELDPFFRPPRTRRRRTAAPRAMDTA